MVACVSISNIHYFKENLLTAQYRLRYREVIRKEKWDDIYVLKDMEFDQYDNPATEYYIARNEAGDVVGVTRSYPTTIPYMLSDNFRYLFSEGLPQNHKILEASRLVLDRSLLTKEERTPVVDRLLVAYMERGLQRGVEGYVGFMLPKIWENTFLRVGWKVKWLGPEKELENTGYKVRAGYMPVNPIMEQIIREKPGYMKVFLNLVRDMQKR